MLPFAHGMDYFVDEQKYTKQHHTLIPLGHGSGRHSSSKSSILRSSSSNRDQEALIIPLSPSRSAATVLQNVAKSKWTWLIVCMILVVVTLWYRAYLEQLRQQRLLNYMERIEDLKASMSRVKHHIIAGSKRVEEIKHVFLSYPSGNISSSPGK